MRRLLALLLCVPVVSWAYDPEQAKVNLASDYATCSAYYMLVSQASEDLKTNPKANTSAKHAWDMAVQLSNVDVTKARIELDTKKMMEEMKFDWSNIAIVVNKYGYLCKEIIEDPEQRLQYWLEE